MILYANILFIYCVVYFRLSGYKRMLADELLSSNQQLLLVVILAGGVLLVITEACFYALSFQLNQPVRGSVTILETYCLLLFFSATSSWSSSGVGMGGGCWGGGLVAPDGGRLD